MKWNQKRYLAFSNERIQVKRIEIKLERKVLFGERLRIFTLIELNINLNKIISKKGYKIIVFHFIK